jgi:hypothetical protein
MVGSLGGSPIFTSRLCGMRGSVSSFQSSMSILFCGPAFVRITSRPSIEIADESFPFFRLDGR